MKTLTIWKKELNIKLKFARMFLILRVGIKAARNVLQVEKKVKFEPRSIQVMVLSRIIKYNYAYYY